MPSRKPEVFRDALPRPEAVPFPVVVGRPVSGGVGREAAGAEARLHCVELYAALEAPLFQGTADSRCKSHCLSLCTSRYYLEFGGKYATGFVRKGYQADVSSC